MIIPLCLIIIIRNFTKFIEKIKTHFMFNKFLSENRAVYEIMRFVCRITKVTDAHSSHLDYIILIALPPATVITQTSSNISFTRTLSILLNKLVMLH
jgi:hypothetical protein